MQAVNKRKCIAVITSKPQDDYQSGILNGIYSVAFDNDINVAVFSSGVPRNDKRYHDGEMYIYQLVNYDELAGVIYIPDYIGYESRDEVITEPLMRAVREKNLPAVCLDYKIDGIPCYHCDDSKVIHDAVAHLVEEHNCRDIAFMTGKKGHYHAENRLNFFRSTMAEYGLTIDPSREYYGDFWYDEGENFVQQLCGSEKGMPEAIICANAHMAESVYMALHRRKIYSPRDILLVSYDDNFPKSPFISSTVKKTDKLGAAACYAVMNMMYGGNTEARDYYIKCECELNRAVTCGCIPTDEYDLLALQGIHFDNGNDYYSEHNAMGEALVGSDNYADMLWAIDWFTYFLPDFKSIYICMCDGWDNPEKSFDESKIRHGFTDAMYINYFRTNNPDGSFQNYVGNDKRFSTAEMFPLLSDAEGEPAAYIMRALHFEDRCFGFIVLTYGNQLRVPEKMYDLWVNEVAKAFEAQRRLQKMRFLYNKMQENAVTDMMTGLLNRNGLNLMLPQLFEEAKQNGCQALIVMGDLNNLKYINDTFGHAEGDESLKTASGALARTWIGGAVQEKNFRIGGYEFIKAAYGHFTQEHLTEFRKALQTFLDHFNANSGKPYPVHISVGFSLRDADSEFNIEEMLFEADSRMYSDKQRIKLETGFNPKRN